MRKIASPQELQSELQRLHTLSKGHQPSRQLLAGELRCLADNLDQNPRQAASGGMVGHLIRSLETQIKKLKAAMQSKDAEAANNAVLEIEHDVKTLSPAVKNQLK
jgi:hypothetical protein